MPDVVTATFTGKAALVLRRKGTPARTIHSLIYSVIEATEEEVEAAAAKIEEAKQQARGLTGFEQTTAEAAIEAMRQALAQMKQPRFALNPQSDAALTQADRARRGVHGRRGDGARPDELRQADPGAGRSRASCRRSRARAPSPATRPTSC